MKQRGKIFNYVLLFISVCLALGVGEISLRLYNSYEIDPFQFSEPQMMMFCASREKIAKLVHDQAIKFCIENRLDTTLYNLDAPKRNYGGPRPEVTEMEKNYSGPNNVDVLKVWNYNFVRNAYNNDSLSFRRSAFDGYSNHCIYCFPPYDSTERPYYCYLPSSVLNGGKLRFNKFGWTGSDVALQKPDSVIRIACIGASTTQQYPDLDFSYPDFFETWFNQWAKKQNLPVKFEVINAGRVSLNSTDIASVYKYEVKPVKPDIIVYYEGRNDFSLDALYEYVPPVDAKDGYNFIGHSILAQTVINKGGLSYYKLFEHEKKSMHLKWPNSINEEDPDIHSKQLPVKLATISDNLKSILSGIDTAHQVFVLCSYPMVTSDTVFAKSDYNYIYVYWQYEHHPFPIKDIGRLNQFENVFYKKFAAENKILFADVAPELLQCPQCFSDGIHYNEYGIKMQAWTIFNKILPVVDAKIKAGKLPYHTIPEYSQHPYLKDNCFMVNLDTLGKKN